jgi:hypothetical protein
VVSQVQQFADLQPVLVPEVFEVRPQLQEPLVSPVAPVEVERLDLELGRDELVHQGAERLTIAAAPGLQASPHRIDVLLRHGLLPQPHRFEGLGEVVVGEATHDRSVEGAGSS